MTLRTLAPLALIALAGISPVMAQSTTSSTTGVGSIANVTCADIASLPAAYQAALIYYAAGFRDGLDVTTNHNGEPVAENPSSQMASASDVSSSAMSPDGDSGAMLGGLGLQAQDIVTACASAGTTLLIDIIDQRGGSSGTGGRANASSSASDVSSGMSSSSEMASDSASSSAAN